MGRYGLFYKKSKVTKSIFFHSHLLAGVVVVESQLISDENCKFCGCGPRPSLEHDTGCPKRLCFYGGMAHWNKNKIYVLSGKRYYFDKSVATWKFFIDK